MSEPIFQSYMQRHHTYIRMHWQHCIQRLVCMNMCMYIHIYLCMYIRRHCAKAFTTSQTQARILGGVHCSVDKYEENVRGNELLNSLQGNFRINKCFIFLRFFFIHFLHCFCAFDCKYFLLEFEARTYIYVCTYIIHT